ncbi:MAG: AAA family ATPase [Pseudomonadota bacterium]
MSLSRGLTLGKFSPLHEGHALLLHAAAAHCTELTVLIGVTSEDPYSFEQRRRWVLDLMAGVSRDSHAVVHVVRDSIADSGFAKDPLGTITNERFWRQWLDQNKPHLEGIDQVFTSDRYGEAIARRIGARWFPVDPDRSVVPISASRIRADLRSNFHYVCDVAKPDVAVTVAVVGAESTGKSVLVKALAEHYGTRFAPEWGRTISEAHEALNASDFDAILTMQDQLIRAAQLGSNGLCFTDTEAITTALFAPIYLGEDHAAAWRRAQTQRFPLYLLLDPEVPWVDDGTRILDQSARLAFHRSLVDALERFKRNYLVVSGRSFEERTRAAQSAVDAFLRGQVTENV